MAGDEGHPQGLLIHPAFVDVIVLAEHEALVGCVDDGPSAGVGQILNLPDLRPPREKLTVALAAGWNAGGQKLGLTLPALVARHGSKRGSAAVINTFRVFRIILTNAMKYMTSGGVPFDTRPPASGLEVAGQIISSWLDFKGARPNFEEFLRHSFQCLAP